MFRIFVELSIVLAIVSFLYVLSNEFLPNSGLFIPLLSLCIIIWRLSAIKNLFAYKYMVPLENLKSHVNQQLYSDNLLTQFKCVSRLALLVGDKFGAVNIYSSNFPKTVKMWQYWWENNHDDLVWKAEIKKYINKKEFPANEER